PEPGPAGQRKGSEIEPVASVPRLTVVKNGKAASWPPLKGTGVLVKETNSTAGASGAAELRSRLFDEFTSSVPVPTRLGTPFTPARPEPMLVHGPVQPPVAQTAAAAKALQSIGPQPTQVSQPTPGSELPCAEGSGPLLAPLMMSNQIAGSLFWL